MAICNNNLYPPYDEVYFKAKKSVEGQEWNDDNTFDDFFDYYLMEKIEFILQDVKKSFQQLKRYNTVKNDPDLNLMVQFMCIDILKIKSFSTTFEELKEFYNFFYKIKKHNIKFWKLKRMQKLNADLSAIGSIMEGNYHLEHVSF